MTKHLSAQEMTYARAYIIRARRDSPDLAERDVYESLLRDAPELEPRLTWSRFRYYWRSARAEAERRGVDVADLPIPDNEIAPGRPYGGVSLGGRLEEAKRALDRSYAEELEYRIALGRKRREIEERRETVAALVRALLGEDMLLVTADEGDPVLELHRRARESRARLADSLDDYDDGAIDQTLAEFDAFTRAAERLLDRTASLSRPLNAETASDSAIVERKTHALA